MVPRTVIEAFGVRMRCRLRGDAGNGAEGALGQIEDDGSSFFVAVVDELVEHHARAGAEGQLGVVVQPELALAVVADLDHLVLAHDVADRQLAFLLVEVGLYDADDGAGVADLGAGPGVGGECDQRQGSDGQCRRGDPALPKLRRSHGNLQVGGPDVIPGRRPLQHGTLATQSFTMVTRIWNAGEPTAS